MARKKQPQYNAAMEFTAKRTKQYSNTRFEVGSDARHVLRVLEAGQISSGKAAELLRAVLAGDTVDLPALVVDDVLIPEADDAPRDIYTERIG